MITTKKKTEDKRVSYSGNGSNEATTSINFSVLDGEVQIGDGTISTGIGMNDSISLNFNIRFSGLTPEDVFSRIPMLLEGGVK